MANEKDVAFDPYHKWLGIPKTQRPPTHYQLLGLSPGEADNEVIEEAAIRQTTHVRAYQVGTHAEFCTRILNEISVARQVLLNPQKRKDYDHKLSQEAAKKGPPPDQQVTARPPLAAPPVARRGGPVAPLAANPFDAIGDEPIAAGPRSAVLKSGRRIGREEKKPAPSSRNWVIAAIAGGGTLIVGLLVLVIMLVSGDAPAVVQQGGPPKPPVEPKPPVFKQPEFKQPGAAR